MKWTPLEYGASLVLLAVIVAYVALRQSGWVMREHEKMLYLWPLHIGAILVGRALGILAWITVKPLFVVYMIGDVWFVPAATWAQRQADSLTNYYRRGQFYQPQHAA